MVATKDDNKVALNKARWLFVLVLIAGGIAANTYYAHVAWAIRAAVGLVVLLIALGVAATTAQGKKAMGFMKSAKIELRKVVWPTRQETVQMTVIVAIMVVIASLILFGLDAMFGALVHWLTSRSGV